MKTKEVIKSARKLAKPYCVSEGGRFRLKHVNPNDTQGLKSGDKLIRLSAALLRQPSDWPEGARFNQLKNPNALKLGQTTQVPVRLMKSVSLGGKILSVSSEVQLGAAKAEA